GASIEEFGTRVFEHDSPHAAYACGMLCNAAGLLEQAVRWFVQSVALAPRSTTYLALGSTLMALGRWDDALAALSRATEIDPNLLPAYFRIAAVHRSQGRIDENIRVLQNALQHFARSRHRCYLHNELGLALEMTGDLEGAAKQFEAAATARHVDTIPMLANLALVLHKLARHADARELVERIIARRQNQARIHDRSDTCFLIYYVLGNSQLEGGNSVAARESFTRCLEFNPNSASAYNSLALACVAAGDPTEAIRALREALRIAPAFETAKRNLDRLAGRAEAARL
ncbi:MAG TPA: tetratricopeptide repeat protein, partial [Blastocatellia bacterium]|nr:tetratricopeptide repeat protein [Blastocatellia bacterium]